MGLLLSFISNPGYPTFIIFLIIFFSITTSTGPVGGAPFPFINVAPLMISWLYGPSPLYLSGALSICEKILLFMKLINRQTKEKLLQPIE